jgi:hypothetical protein
MKREIWLQAAPASVGTARAIVGAAAAELGLDGGCRYEPCPQGLRVEVWDCGRFEAPRFEPTPLEETSGRGMPIIAAVVDRLEVQNDNGHTLVRFERHAAAA